MIEDTLKQLNKKYGAGTIQRADKFHLDLKRISTGSLSLDIELGGGLPFGRMVELYGPEGSGKSSLANKIIKNVQDTGGTAVWIDLEGVYDPTWVTKLGVDTSKLLLAAPETGESAGDILDSIIRSGECKIIVIDSVAAIIPQLDVNKSMSDEEKMGDRALLNNRMVRKVHAAFNAVGEKAPLVIFINQIRETFNAYGAPYTTPGGRGLKFGASIRINIQRGDWIELDEKNQFGKKIKVGHTVKFNIEKNKTAPPHRVGSYDFYFAGERQGQIDNRNSLIFYGILKGIIKDMGAGNYKYNGVSVRGKETFLRILEDKKIYEELETAILGVNNNVTKISSKTEHKEGISKSGKESSKRVGGKSKTG